MEFTLAGQSFELNADIVRRKLEGRLPESIQEYWVEVDGVRWPVKQVMAVATGLDRRRFQSQHSRRLLERIGFSVGQGGSVISANQRNAKPRGSRAAFDADALDVLESVDVRVAFEWLRAGPITLDSEGLPKFPPLPRLPGLYRYDFGIDDAGVRTLYIGESVDVARRASNYRNAKTDRSRQRTSRRIHKEIVQHLRAGHAIEFAIATRVTIHDGADTDLRLKSARRLAENAAVLRAQTSPSTRVLNIDADLGDPEVEE